MRYSVQTTEKPDLLIRRGSLEETDRILELVRLSLGEGLIPRSEAYWRWKHFENPFGDSPILLAEHEGKLVGLRVFMRWEWIKGGRTFRAVRAVDTATHPDWRGKGIFSRLTRQLVDEMREEGVDFIFNTPNEQSRPGYLKMGWESVGRTDVSLRPLSPFRMARAFIGRKNAAAEHVEIPSPQFETAEEAFANPGLRALTESITTTTESGGYSTPLSWEYLRWRYAHIPGFTYHVLQEHTEDGGAAVFFRYKTQGQLLELRIGDIIMGSSRESETILSGLLKLLIRKAGADYTSAMPVDDRQNRILRRQFFLPAVSIGPILTVRPLNELSAAPSITSKKSWRASTGALELF